MECPACGGAGCEACGQRGRYEVKKCPARALDARTWLAVRLAEAAARGTWPVAGGLLDQAYAFVEAARLIWHDTERLKMDAAGPAAALLGMLGGL